MTPESIAALIMSFVALLGFGFNFFKWRREEKPQLRKTGSESDSNMGDAAESMAAAAKALIEPLEKRVNEQNEKIVNLEKKVNYLEHDNFRLQAEGEQKDARILELERLTAAQEAEISALKKQLELRTPAMKYEIVEPPKSIHHHKRRIEMKKKMSITTANTVSFWYLLITCILLILPLLSTYLQVFGLSDQVLLMINGTIAFLAGVGAIILKVFFTDKPAPTIK